MAFIEYIKSKRNFVIIWLLFHGLALFVNVFNIQGDISYTNEYIKDRTSYRYYHDIYLLTTKSGVFTNHQKKSEGFWPFVKFYINRPESREYNTNGYAERQADYYEGGISEFNGIFFQYDYSEFLAYSILILLILYFKWNSKIKTS